MGILGSFGKSVGGLLFVLGLIAFITFYALNSSGILGSAYLNEATGQIINSSGYNASQEHLLEQTVSNFTRLNPGCANLLCFVSQQFKINLPTSSSNFSTYQLLAEIALVFGLILLIFSYEGGDRLRAIVGRGLLSAAILSFVSTYLPLVFILPYLLAIPIQGLSLSIPSSVTAPFTGVVLFLDIIFGAVGIALIILNLILLRRSRATPVKP